MDFAADQPVERILAAATHHEHQCDDGPEHRVFPAAIGPNEAVAEMERHGDAEKDQDGSRGEAGEKAQRRQEAAEDLDRAGARRCDIAVGEAEPGLEELTGRLQPVTAEGAEQLPGAMRDQEGAGGSARQGSLRPERPAWTGFRAAMTRVVSDMGLVSGVARRWPRVSVPIRYTIAQSRTRAGAEK